MKIQIRKNKTTHDRVVRDGCIWEEIPLINDCWVRQSVFYQILMPSVMVCLKQNVLWWTNNISFKENTENVVYIIPCKSRLDTNYCQVQGWKNLVHASTMYEMSFWGEQNIMQENDSYVHLKMERIISGTQFDSWFPKRSMPRCTFLHCGARRHQNSQQDINKIVYEKFQFFHPLNYTHVN